MRLIFKYGASILLLLISLPLSAQKVGLVLSGGGARGVAHIGILKALEENNIPIDYIAGTSMGAIIGGFYASGYSPGEIEKIFTSGELQYWINGVKDPKYNHFFKATDPNASWQIVKIAIDSALRIKLPANIISPYEMDFRFLEWFAMAGAACNYNFDSLVFPFRCIASDISESKYVTLRDGQLDKAIRASMTFPFYFKPIKINGKLMFDGGMYNNFPVDVMIRDFQPDIIIGCKAASNYGPPKDDDVISQVQSMLMANTQYKVDDKTGVMIEPELKSVSITDFSNTREFIDSGYAEAMKQIPRIKRLLIERNDNNQLNSKIAKFNSGKPKLRVGDIIFHGVNRKQEAYLDRLISRPKQIKILEDTSLPDKFKLEKIKFQYYRILAESQVASVNPELIYNSQSRDYDLIYNIDRNNRFEGEVGGLVTSKTTNEIFLKVQYSRWSSYLFSMTGNAYLGRFHNSGQGILRMDVPGSLPLAFELSYTLNGWNYFKTSTYFFEDVKPNYLVQQDSYWKFNASTPFTNFARIIAEFSTGTKTDNYYQTNQFSRLDTTDKTTFSFYSPGLLFEYSSLNRKQFASEGTFMRLCGRLISGLETNVPGSTSIDTTVISNYHNWFQIRFIYDQYFRATGKLRPGIYLSATLSNKPFFNNYASTALSAVAFEPIPESQTIFLPQFRANNFAAAGGKLIYNMLRNFDIRAEGYIFQPYEGILKTAENKAQAGEPFSNRYYIASASFVYHAPIGPISMCLNYYDQAEAPFSFNLNIGYFIFNKRPFH